MQPRALAHKGDSLVSGLVIAHLVETLGMLQPERMGMADIAYYAGPHYFDTADKIFNMKAE